MTTLERKATYPLVSSIMLVVIFSFTFSSCDRGGNGFIPFSGTPYIYAELDSFPTGSVPPGFTNNTVSVFVEDTSNGALITNATAIMNGVTLQYNSNHQQYEGTVVVSPGDPVTLSVTVDGKTYTASTTQFSEYPVITSPTPNAAWSVNEPHTVTWSGGAPTTNAFYGLGVLDANSGEVVWPSYGYLQELTIETSSYTIDPNSLTMGSRFVIVGIGAPVPISNAFEGSHMVVAGFNYVPVTLPPGIVALPGSGQVTLRWDTVENATYDIYWSTNPDIKSIGTQISNVTSPYVHTGLTNGTTYYYFVTAVGARGQNTDSSTVSATPAAVMAIAGGTANTVALKGPGTAWGWGGYLPGLPEYNNSHYYSSIPVPLCATAGASPGTCGSYLTDIAAVAGGDSYTVVLKNDGTVWTWGYDYEGNLGNNDSSNITYFPVQVCATAGASPGTCGSYLTGITAIEASGTDGWMQSTIALRNDSTVWAWGANLYGQLGNNSAVSSTIPVQVCATAGASAGTCGSYLTSVTAIAAGEAGFTLALKNDGTVWAWGDNSEGQLGNNSRSNSLVPVQVCATAGASTSTCGSYLTGVTVIAAGYNHAAALKNDGSVWTWGANDCGDLGHNNAGMFGAGGSLIPVQVCATAGATEDTCGTYLTGITAITATAVLKNDGTVWTWGCSGYVGALGNNSTASSPIPVQVCATAGATAGTCGSYLTDITAITRKYCSVALRNDGTVWTWGNNAIGSSYSLVPLQSAVSGPGSVSAPSGLTAGAAGSNTVNVTWSASSGASSYNVYWSTRANISPLTGTMIPLGNVTNYAHTGLAAGTRYYYVVTAVDSLGNESTGSRVATAVAQ